ncbi:MAG: 2-oxoglutarate dehydrogenase E1 component, partial [Bacteroidetes bacterium CG_4_8_14_3_um_filter_31_14]
TNPVHPRRQYLPTLEIQNFNLTEADLNKTFHAGSEIGIGNSTLSKIIEHLEQTYCQSVGAEFVYIRQPEIVNWLTKRMESTKNRINFNKEQKSDIFKILLKTVGFEQFLHKKFVGQKRFSLEGAEALIPAIGYAIEHGVEMGIKEFIIGNSHRGRLNILANIFKKPYHSIFSEYSGKTYDEDNILGDVKYHLSYDTHIKSRSGKEMFLALLPNPSHLETVGPVTQGLARARIESEYKNDFNKVCPIVIHGDAAIAAQGVVYETIQMSQLEGYKTGGTLHFVVNNQVGFTTNYIDARSSTYCTDIAKVTLSPVFHVNGDDVEAVLYTIQLALEYREKFHSDVFIDLLCYRKYGHNEGDEPRFTQPILYKEIASHPNVRDIYSKYLIETGVLTQEDVTQKLQSFNNKLDEQLEISKQSEKVEIKHFLHEKWANYRYANENDFLISPQTGVNYQKLINLSEKINYLPKEKKFFNKIEKIVNDRKKLISENKVDWALAELLAYASIVTENYPVRISGQDSERGTFSHRHSTFHVDDTDEKWCPLKNIAPEQAKFQIYNSLLSEYAVLGFEYGYAMGTPNGLTIWEAQFGDFHNVAQVIIDQYLSSAEDKWGLMNGLVLFLPHGFEGQGPEHSSARIERFLVLAANNNMQIVNCSTPANIFHVLRRQVFTDYRKPLIIFTPKSLLRHPLCISNINELSEG